MVGACPANRRRDLVVMAGNQSKQDPLPFLDLELYNMISSILFKLMYA